MMAAWAAVAPDSGALILLAVRAAVLLAGAWGVAALLRRGQPAVRQVLWTSVVVGVVVLPVLSLVMPGWAVLPSLPEWAALQAEMTEVIADPGSSSLSSVASARLEASVEPTLGDAAGRWRVHWSWLQIAMLVWGIGAILLAARLVSAWRRLQAIGRRASPASRPVVRLAGAVAEELNLRRAVSYVVSSEIASPATWGWRRPVIALPAAAASWSEQRLELVLAHELVHVARSDWAFRLLAQLGCVLYWFNPLAWLASRQLRREQELACDLAVVRRGTRASTYARHLLNIARAAAGGRVLPLVALDMARRSQMEGRLMSILTDRSAPALRGALILPALAVVLALPVLAAVQPQAPVPSPEPEIAMRPAPAIEPEPVVAPLPAAAEAPSPPRSEPSVAPDPPVEPLYELDEASRDLAERMARKAEEIQALRSPVQEEMERLMAESMRPVIERMEQVELEMRPFAEEMSRIGQQLSEEVMAQLLDTVDVQELQEKTQELATLHEGMAEKHRVAEEEMRSRMEPYREQMEALRERLEPQREQMEQLRTQLEPMREQMEGIRDERMAEIQVQLEVLRHELEALRDERQR